MSKNKKTRIVGTIGPASQNKKILNTLVSAGLDVIRINMSHGDHPFHLISVETVREVRQETGKPIPILCDLAGPKIRLGDFATETIELKVGKKIILTPEKISGNADRVHINYPTLAEELKKGSIILLNDGKQKLEVTEIKGKDVVTKILVGGVIKPRRGVNLPGANLKIPALTDKDKKDVAWGIENKVEFFALSFVRRPEDVSDLRKILNKAKSKAKIISKIETPEAVENIDEILKLSDGLMVARGDLAVEVGFSAVPPIQKKLVMLANKFGKPVIVATHMLESMTRAPVPTRAEVSDIANAVADGADAVMLSEELAVGEFPLETVKLMTEVCLSMELMTDTHRRLKVNDNSLLDSLASSVIHIAEDVKAKGIVALTDSGSTTALISRFKPTMPILAFAIDEYISRQSCLSYGVNMFMTGSLEPALSDLVDEIKKNIINQKIGKKGDVFVLTGGLTCGIEVGSNALAVITI